MTPKKKLLVTGTNDYVDVQYGNQTARFWGDLCSNGFAAITSTMEWHSSEGGIAPTDDERAQFVSAVRRLFRRKRFKVFFVDEIGEDEERLDKHLR